MPKYKLHIAYDGTQYGGWQTQPNSTCIQDLIEQALSTILRQKIDVVGSGRTDAGVHALGQVAHFTTSSACLPDKVLYSANALLPKDIRLRALSEVDDAFHARYSASRKIYHYFLHTDPIDDPFKKHYALHVQHRLDISALRKAAGYLVGTHDFSAFANQQLHGSAGKDAVRTIYRADIVEIHQGLRLEFEGSGFLYKMVRNMVGTLLEIGGGKRSPSDIVELLRGKDRAKAGKAAEAKGLFLVEVIYSKESSSKEATISAPLSLSC